MPCFTAMNRSWWISVSVATRPDLFTLSVVKLKFTPEEPTYPYT